MVTRENTITVRDLLRKIISSGAEMDTPVLFNHPDVEDMQELADSEDIILQPQVSDSDEEVLIINLK